MDNKGGHEEIMMLGIDKIFSFCNDLIAETEQCMKKISEHTKRKEENIHTQMKKIHAQTSQQNTEKGKEKRNIQTDTTIER